MRKFIVPALLAATFASPAWAQDDAAASAAFTGPRIEALVGYDRLGQGDSIEGAAYGGAVGFDFALGGLSAGVEGEYLESTGDQDIDEEDFGLAGTFDVGRDLYVGGRVGFLVGGSTLLYAKGGYTTTNLEFGFEDEDGERLGLDADADGYRIGAGIEHAVEEGIGFIKLEYRYSNYGNLSFDNDEVDDALDQEDLQDVDVDRHQVLVGVGVRF